MTPLSTDERRALAILAALLLLAGGARWLERPQPILDGVPDLDVARLEEESRAARDGGRPRAGSSAGATRAGAPPPPSPPAPAGPGTPPPRAAAGAAPGGAAQGGAAQGGASAAGRSPVAPVLPAPAMQGAATSPGASVSAVDLNRASAADLQQIPGIGPAMAARIIARRDSIGSFRSFDDVDAVRGVGPVLLERIRAAAVIRP